VKPPAHAVAPLTVAVTGGRGFLGAAVVDRLLARGHVVLALDVVPGDGLVVDVRDEPELRRIFAAEGVRRVVHAAAVVGVPAVREHLSDATDINVLGSLAVLRASASTSVDRVVDLSSEEIYGDGGSAALLPEDTFTRPLTAYGVHKLAVELLAREFAETLSYAATRLSWVYGRGFPRARPPQSWLDDAREGRPSAPAAGADHVVDLIHVDDAVSALVALVEAPRLEHSAYNVGSGEGVRLAEVADLIRSLSPEWAMQQAPGRLPGVPMRPPLDTTRIREELGWIPDLSLEEGLRRTLHGR
jgi:nucleoside-diphosphate-sugar epimerase